jgi:GH24 family phage-related lysozyme (muramidase)
MNNIDWNFIKELEGFSSKGYVPKDEKKNKVPSGVTIGSGFDIGQLSRLGLELYGFSKELCNKLEPYCNVTGDKARKLLEEKPLELSDKLIAELERVSREKITNNIVNEYNLSSPYCKFSELSCIKQTVIASIGFQYGSVKRRCPRFFKYVIEGRWSDAIHELENFGDAYPTRRKKEANLLRKELTC